MFEYEGDYGWARWSAGVHCAECRRMGATDIEAIGVEVVTSGNFILVEPVCEECATEKNILLFEGVN